MSQYSYHQIAQVTIYTIGKFKYNATILHIFRYKTDGELGISKISSTVSTGKIQDDKIVVSLFGNTYCLKSVLFHLGVGVNSGHYTAIVNEGQDWYHFNDNQVTCKTTYKNRAHKSSENYVMCYKLQNQ